jgi:hypothetical protein
MLDIASGEGYHCPEAVLLIIGGNPKHNWQVASYVYLRTGERILLELDSNGADDKMRAEDSKRR